MSVANSYLTELFWFRRLPCVGNNEDNSLLLSDFQDFLNKEGLLPKKVIEAFTNWADVQAQHDTDKPQLGLNEFQAQNVLGRSNQVLPLYIQNCNACLIIRTNEDDSAMVSAFTVHPKNKEIMLGCCDLLLTYPEITVQVQDKKSMLSTGEFTAMLHDLFSNQISQIRAKSSKAGKVEEQRDVVSSRIVTEWLVAVLGGTTGSIDVGTIQKKYRNSIEWSDTLYPYRRSGLWMSIKTVLQLLLFWKYGEKEGKIIYKVILLLFLVHTAEKLSSGMKDELKLQVISKLSTRLDKLQTLASSTYLSFPSSGFKQIFTKVFEFVKKTREEIDRNWKEICEKSTFFNASLKSASNKSLNVYQQLSDSIEEIIYYVQLEQRQVFINKPVPSSIIRSFDISSFKTVVHKDGCEKSISELFVIEEWVKLKMMNDRYCTPINLERLMVEYKSVAQNVYSNDPIGFSRMILTCLSVIRRLIEFAKKTSYIFEEYKTGINVDAIFNYLLLTTADQFKYAFELEKYFKDFEQSARYQPDFLSNVCEDSFSVRYAKNYEMQQLRRRIELEVERAISEKKDERKSEYRRYEEYLEKANNQTHEQFIDNRSRVRCMRNCAKCYYNRVADRLHVQPYEKVLPEKDYEKDAIVFELLIPTEIQCIQNALIAFAELDNSYKTNQNGTNCTVFWSNYLSKYKSNNTSNRVSLTSSVKSFMTSHYSSQDSTFHPRNPESHFIKKNALNLSIAIDGKYVNFSSPNIVKECRFLIDQKEKYQSLDGFLENYSHNQNMILSNQNACHTKLSLSEYLEFGSFRAGYRLQMHNLTKVLSNNLLSFDQEDVCFLILQSLLQTCPSDNSWWRGTNEPVRDEKFCLELISLLKELLEKVKNNWKSIYQLTTVVFCSKKILELSGNEKVSMQCEALLFHARDVALEWLSKTNEVLTNILDNPKENTKIRNLQIDIACCCCLTFHPQSNLLRDFSKWLIARSIIYENLILNSIGIDSLPQFRKTLLRETIRTSQSIQDNIYKSFNRNCTALTEFLKEKWCETKTMDLCLKWEQYPNSENWYFVELESPKCIVQVNVVDGALLINHAPIGRLPSSVTKKPEYMRIFKNLGK